MFIPIKCGCKEDMPQSNWKSKCCNADVTGMDVSTSLQEPVGCTKCGDRCIPVFRDDEVPNETPWWDYEEYWFDPTPYNYGVEKMHWDVEKLIAEQNRRTREELKEKVKELMLAPGDSRHEPMTEEARHFYNIAIENVLALLDKNKGV